MLRLDKVIKPWKESAALNDHINLYGFWNETTFVTKSGDVGMVLSISGVDYESLDRSEQEYAVKRLEAALKAFGPGFSDSISAFRNLLGMAGIPESSSAIICRANDHLQSVRGQVNYANLTGVTKRLAESAFYRDCRRDYKEAFDRVEGILRELIWNDKTWAVLDDSPDCAAAEQFRETVWKFVKSDQGLPSVSLNGDVWVATMKDRMAALIASLGAPPIPTLGKKIQKRGLKPEQFLLPLFEEQKLFPNIRHETIHQVKGESIGAVLVIGSSKFWNSVVDAVVSEKNNEDRRLAYVAMTRAKDLLVLSLPSNHFDKHLDRWSGWGFDPLQ